MALTTWSRFEGAAEEIVHVSERINKSGRDGKMAPLMSTEKAHLRYRLAKVSRSRKLAQPWSAAELAQEAFRATTKRGSAKVFGTRGVLNF